MRLPFFLFPLLFLQFDDGTATTASEAPTFSGSNLVEVKQPYQLTLSAPPSDLVRWKIDWGDGTKSVEAMTASTSSHVYQTPGRYAVKVEAETSRATLLRVVRDYANLLQQDTPLATTDSISTHDFMSALAVNTAAAHQATSLKKISSGLMDQFSVEFWLRPDDFSARQDLFDATGTQGKPTQLYLENNALRLSLPQGDTFVQPLAHQLAPGTWHHVALTYDRASTFPYNNVARFYIDGLLIGKKHLDRYDTGSITLPSASIGRAPDGSSPLHGSIAGVAVYDHWLNPTHLLDRTRVVSAPNLQYVNVVPKNAETFTVDSPRLSTVVDVALNPDPSVDNGPVLRAAIDAAAPGTRLRIINSTTHTPGGRFYFNSLASGQDWTALRFFRKTDFELDGGGADFIFRTANRQLAVRQSIRIAFRNFNIDLDPDKYRVGCYARILDVDASSGTVRFQFVHGRDMTPDRTVPSAISMWRWRPHDPKTLRIQDADRMFFETDHVFGKEIGRDPSDPSILIGHTTNAKMLEAFQKYRNGVNFFMVNNADFRNTSVSIWDQCSQLTFDHVNFYGTLGMVFLSSDYDHLQITHCRIGLPPGETAADRPLASGADGFHFHENHGYTLFQNNEITLTDDDPISIKDGLWRNVTSSDPRTIQIKDFHPGDQIELYRNDISPLDYVGTVTAVQGGDVTVDPPLPPDLPKTFLAQNYRERSFHWILKDSYFHDYYGRFLLYTPWGRATGNRITKSYFHLGTATASFDDGGISSHVVVDNNILFDTNADTGLWGADSTYPVFDQIAFVDNAFIHRGLNISNAGNLLIAGNYFENVVAKDRDVVALSLHHSTHVQLTGNIQAGIGIKDFGLKIETTAGLLDEDNSSIAFPSDISSNPPTP